MKYHEATFEGYLARVKERNIHKVYEPYYKDLPERVKDLNHTILYGADGCGKYSQALQYIKKYSSTELKYEKKISIVVQKKNNFVFKISDIHYEIDMDLLGCNSKNIWNDFLSQVVDIISTTKNKEGFILCKNFQKINLELLDIFHGYMNKLNSRIHIKYILLTNCISFLPLSFLECFNIIKLMKPSVITYNRILDHKIKTKHIMYNTNIKDFKSDILYSSSIAKNITETLVSYIEKRDPYLLNDMRETMYDILIYHLDVNEILWEIISMLGEKIPFSKYYDLNIELYRFFKYYNNNYRPIFHIERIILFLSTIVNGL